MAGFVDMMSKPALLAAIAYLIMAFVILIPLGVAGNDYNKQLQFGFGKRLMVVILLIIPIALSIYSINCMVVGQCHVWAWVQGIAIAFWVLMFIVASLISNETSRELAAELAVTDPSLIVL